MTRRLKRITPLQAGKVVGLLYACLGLIIVPFFLLMALVGAFAQPNESGAAGGAIAAGVMIVMALLAPVMYGAMGFVIGILSAALYNLIARWVGGIEFEVEDVNDSSGAASVPLL